MTDALFLQLGYNAALVTLGAMLLGLAAGIAGVFLFLRKRALVSDAISHATLPGIGLAFITSVALGGDGRSLPLLMIGAAASAGLGLLWVNHLTRRTRLNEDAAIGAALSVFFGFGVVLLTVIQSMSRGQQAGLEGFLLGSTSGMLRSEAWLLALSAFVVLVLVVLLRRPLTLSAFDPGYAETRGLNVAHLDLAIMALALTVTVVGLKVVGLILIVALLIIPPVTARFWTDNIDHLLLISGGIGGLSGYLGAAISASAPNVPTGPVIVLICFSFFIVSLIASPLRGALSHWLKFKHYQRRVHMRQGLLSLAQAHPIRERFTLRLLQNAGHVTPDGIPTHSGREQAAKTLKDETRWAIVRADQAYAHLASLYDGMTDIETCLTPDQLADVDAKIPKAVAT